MKNIFLILTIINLMVISSPLIAKGDKSAPSREEGSGPYNKLILRGGILINGEGAPARGPMDIVIENDRITQIVNVGNPGVPIKSNNRPIAEKGDIELDIEGQYVLPGFIDMH